MVKYTGPKVKIIRRLGLLPGFCKKHPKNRTYTPGEHGKSPLVRIKKRRLSLSDDYRNRLVEKQKLRFNYGITEKQLLSYYKKAKESKESTGLILLEILESRLDCIIYRLGFAKTIPAARQLINHKHILVNGKTVNIPSFLCQPGDEVSVKEKSKAAPKIKQYFKFMQILRGQIIKRLKAFMKVYPKKVKKASFRLPKTLLPSHLETNSSTLFATIKSRIKRSNVGMNIKELKIIEYYSR